VTARFASVAPLRVRERKTETEPAFRIGWVTCTWAVCGRRGLAGFSCPSEWRAGGSVGVLTAKGCIRLTCHRSHTGASAGVLPCASLRARAALKEKEREENIEGRDRRACVRAHARVYARVRRGWASVPMLAYVCTCPPLCRPLDWSAPPKRVGSEMSTVRLRVPLAVRRAAAAVLPRRDVRTAGW
jgi:hypothetical protein